MKSSPFAFDFALNLSLLAAKKIFGSKIEDLLPLLAGNMVTYSRNN